MADLPKSYDSSFSILDAPVNHLSQALRNNLEQFKGMENVEKLLDILLNPLETLHTDLLTMQRTLSVERATGGLLDLLGTRLGVTRTTGNTDEEYKRQIVYQITANNCQGTLNEIINIIILLIDDEESQVEVLEAWPAQSVVQITFEDMNQKIVDSKKISNLHAGGISTLITTHDETTTPFSLEGTGLGFSAAGETSYGSMACNYKLPLYSVKPFSLDIVTYANSAGLGATDMPNEQGQLVTLDSFIDTTGDGIPDSIYNRFIEGKDFTTTASLELELVANLAEGNPESKIADVTIIPNWEGIPVEDFKISIFDDQGDVSVVNGTEIHSIGVNRDVSFTLLATNEKTNEVSSHDLTVDMESNVSAELVFQLDLSAAEGNAAGIVGTIEIYPSTAGVDTSLFTLELSEGIGSGNNSDLEILNGTEIHSVDTQMDYVFRVKCIHTYTGTESSETFTVDLP